MTFPKTFLKSLRLTRLVRKTRDYAIIALDNLGGLFFSFFRISQQKEFVKDPKNILVVRLDGIGDVILTTPAIRALRQGYHNAKIEALVNEYTKPMLVGNPYIDRVIIYGRDRLAKHYDMAIAFSQGFKSNFAVFCSKSKYRFGYSGHGGSFLLNYKIKDDRQVRFSHEIDFALSLAFLAGGKAEDKELDVFESEESAIFVHNYFQKNKLSKRFAVVHPGSRQDYIRWPKDRFALLCDLLIKECKLDVILIGARQEKSLLEEVSSLMKEKCLIVYKFELKQIISLIKRCALFVGNSSGPMHIAAALKIPLVAIFGSKHPLDSSSAWGHRGRKQVVVEKDAFCHDCHPGDCFDYKCMDNITVSEVFDACKKITEN
jgi:lipopolysaccharide heptosyltransferase II